MQACRTFGFAWPRAWSPPACRRRPVVAGLSSPAAAQTFFSGGVFGADGLPLTKADIALLNRTVRTALETLPNGQAEK